MKKATGLIAIVLTGLIISSCDQKNARLVSRRVATPEKIEEIKQAQKAKEEEKERARIEAEQALEKEEEERSREEETLTKAECEGLEELFDETKIIGAEEFKGNRKISQMKEAQEERAKIWADYLAKHPGLVNYYAKNPIKAQKEADYWYEQEQKRKREAEERAIRDELEDREFKEKAKAKQEEEERAREQAALAKAEEEQRKTLAKQEEERAREQAALAQAEKEQKEALEKEEERNKLLAEYYAAHPILVEFYISYPPTLKEKQKIVDDWLKEKEQKREHEERAREQAALAQAEKEQKEEEQNKLLAEYYAAHTIMAEHYVLYPPTPEKKQKLVDDWLKEKEQEREYEERAKTRAIKLDGEKEERAKEFDRDIKRRAEKLKLADMWRVTGKDTEILGSINIGETKGETGKAEQWREIKEK